MQRLSIGFVLVVMIGVLHLQLTQAQKPMGKQPSQAPKPIKKQQNSRVPYMVEDKLRLTVIPPPAAKWHEITTTNAFMLANYVANKSEETTLIIGYTPSKNLKALPNNLPATVAAEIKKQFTAFTLVSNKRVKVAGEKGWQIDGQAAWLAQKKKGTMRNRQVYLLHGGLIYIFSLTTTKEKFSKFAPTLEALVNSIRWVPANGKSSLSPDNP